MRDSKCHNYFVWTSLPSCVSSALVLLFFLLGVCFAFAWGRRRKRRERTKSKRKQAPGVTATVIRSLPVFRYFFACPLGMLCSYFCSVLALLLRGEHSKTRRGESENVGNMSTEAFENEAPNVRKLMPHSFENAPKTTPKYLPGGLWAAYGAPGVSGRALWSSLGSSWGALGGSWGHLGSLLAAPGAVLGLPGGPRELPGRVPEGLREVILATFLLQGLPTRKISKK